MNLLILPGVYSVCHLNPDEGEPDWGFGRAFRSITRTDAELSIICSSDLVPEETEQERGWCGIEVEGPLAFSQIGILAGLLQPLADAQIPVFVVSTYQTDYIFLKEQQLSDAIKTLEIAGHSFIDDALEE
jgi:hypothetical protein